MTYYNLLGYNILEKRIDTLQIIKTSVYKRDLKRKIINKHMDKEYEELCKIEDLLLSVNNMQELINHPLKNVYGIEKKKGNLKDIYTADLNTKIRLYFRPMGDYPYNLIEIEKVEFEKIDNKHYGEG